MMPVSAAEILRLDRVWKRHRRWKRRPLSVKEALIRALKRVGPEYEDFWAVQDVSLTVRRGEVLGFCGANGAGKSTLLRVVAGTVPPTFGTVTLRGRIATLLELGAGFLPDLTGRENVALNGAILGLSDAEIRAKEDAIVAFADLGDFIDSPVRTYSSGMYMRLGFAIASHVEADILLLDEVLAVGDAEFQRKCAAWLAAQRAAQTTVLLVSHDLSALAALCDRVAWMERGRVRACGAAAEVVGAYASHPPLPAAAALEATTP
jgi:ABC-type polysaccharide/polyol phosphate transport system ATPase subunit